MDTVVDMPLVQTAKQLSDDHLPLARSYQLDALDMALKQNTIVFLETGSGKTLVGIMLLRSYAHCLRKPSSFLAVFLVPTVVLVSQQAEVVQMHTDLKVGKYWGEMGVDFWNAADWKKQQDEFEVLVMTPQILLNALRHSFIKLETIRVLIFDECHHARGRHPYACIMTEFYHRQVESNNLQLPRILGMTASPISTKGSTDGTGYWKQIHELENLMNSKVFTCSSESVIADCLPLSTPKLMFYTHVDIPQSLFEKISIELKTLKEKFEYDIEKANVEKPHKENAMQKLSKICSTFFFCLTELGLWLAIQAADSLSSQGREFIWDKLDNCGERMIRDFTIDAFKIFSGCMPSDPDWSISDDLRTNVANGYLSAKVICLFESFRERRGLKDLRCIVFVERVVTAIALCRLLNVLLPSLSGWKTEYMAGSSSLQIQTRKAQNKIVEEFRKGTVNIIVATSVLEEGLDVQSCNLVVRFDPSATVCSFIQSRGRARMQNSEFLILVKRGDNSSLARVENYLSSGKVMRQESLRHAAVPCQPLDTKIYDEVFYRVDSTGAIVTLSSSVSMICFYCSRLPSDGYFKPFPRCIIDKDLQKCTLYLPKSCPLPTVTVLGSVKTLKQLACLEACKTLHRMGALTDNLIPDMVEEEDAEEMGHVDYVDEHDIYVPSELVGQGLNNSAKTYYCYLLKLDRRFSYDIPMDDLMLAASNELNFGEDNISFELEVDRGSIAVHIKYCGSISLTSEQVLMCQQFQVKLFRVLYNNNYNKLKETIDVFHPWNDRSVYDYLLLPTTGSQKSPTIDWRCVIRSILYKTENICHDCRLSEYQYNIVQTRNGLVCRCVLENSLVCTPYNDHIYCISGTIDGMNGSSVLNLKDGESMTYKTYYGERHGIDLQFERVNFLKGRHIFLIQNHLHKYKKRKEQEPSNAFVELPPELCSIFMSPISVSTCYTFAFASAIMHRIESLLIASNLKKRHADYCNQNVIATTKIPTIKVLEAITTKKCEETFDLESLKALGDSFLKYAACQQVFKKHQNKHEGILSIKKNKIISKSNLCKLGCSRNLPGLIRNEPFDPKMWIIPGDQIEAFHEVQLSTATKVYSKGTRKIKSKVVADVVKALIGVFLSCGGEVAALSFMNWIGIEVDFSNVPYKRSFQAHPEKLLNISYLESMLNYSFKDATLLVEALTHGSFMLPQIPLCYQRLEFLGDSVLDYLVTMHLYNRYPGMSPGLLTDMRSASVNNDCYSLSAVKVGLQKHILHASKTLHWQIGSSVQNLDPLLMGSTFGWESENSLPKVLGDIIESLAGAILVDSGYNKDIVFKIILPLLEPLVSPETLKLQPARELHQLCQKENYVLRKPVVSCENGVAAVTIEVEANGVVHKESCTAPNKAEAKKLASKAVLKLLKESMSMEHHPIPFISSPKGKKKKKDEGESHEMIFFPRDSN